MGAAQSSAVISTNFKGSYTVYKCEYKWIVPDFKKLLSNGVGTCTTSEDLSIPIDGENHTFKLLLYPSGYNIRLKNYLSIWLQKTSPRERHISFTCSLMNTRGGKLLENSLKKTLAVESHLGWAAFCQKNVIMDDESAFLRDGKLTLLCRLEVYSDDAILNPEVESENEGVLLHEFSGDMSQMLAQEDFHDLELKVSSKKFRVHKTILSARSPVFNAMLKSPLKATSRPIDITDISADVFKDVLNYMYSGKVSYLTVSTASELYYAADKYELYSLRSACSKVLKCNLEPDNVISVLLIAEKHSDKDLKETCVQFIAKNATDVQERSEWVQLMESHPEVANLVFKRLAL